jgi:hypothetical protein
VTNPGEGMKYILSSALLLIATISVAGNPQSNIETNKINYLINSIEALDGAKFTRNGTEYNGKEAAEHLRYKLKKAGNRVKSAEDFITMCGSKSYISGRPYMIKLSDGKTIPSEEYLRTKLKEYNSTGK